MDKILITSQDESNKIADRIVELLIIIAIAFIVRSFVDPKIKSEVRYKIDAILREHKVAIPFFQRDVYLFHHIKNQ